MATLWAKLLALLLHFPCHPILAILLNLFTGSTSQDTGTQFNALHTKLFPPRISSSSFLLHVTCAISSKCSLLDLLDHLIDTSVTVFHFELSVTNDRSLRHAAPHLLWIKLSHTLCVSYHCGVSSSPRSSPSCCDSRPVVDISHGVFYSRLETLLFSVFFLHSHLSLNCCSGSSAGILPLHVWQSLAV